MKNDESKIEDFERKTFEDFMAKRGYLYDTRLPSGEYMSWHFVLGWAAWKAAKAHKRERQKTSVQPGEPINSGPWPAPGENETAYERGNIFQQVEWAKTQHGGRKYDMFKIFDETPQCASSYGLCE